MNTYPHGRGVRGVCRVASRRFPPPTVLRLESCGYARSLAIENEVAGEISVSPSAQGLPTREVSAAALPLRTIDRRPLWRILELTPSGANSSIFGTGPVRIRLVFQAFVERGCDNESDFWNRESCFSNVFQYSKKRSCASRMAGATKNLSPSRISVAFAKTRGFLTLLLSPSPKHVDFQCRRSTESTWGDSQPMFEGGVPNSPAWYLPISST